MAHVVSRKSVSACFRIIYFCASCSTARRRRLSVSCLPKTAMVADMLGPDYRVRDPETRQHQSGDVHLWQRLMTPEDTKLTFCPVRA